MTSIEDHPLRYALANELHARPFPTLNAPSRAAYLAIKQPENAVARDRDEDRAHLIALLDRYGAAHPQPGSTHYSGDLGKYRLKWESHTEFVTYTIFRDRAADEPYDAKSFEIFPKDWLASAPGQVMTSALVRIEKEVDPEAIATKVNDWFVPESMAVSSVLDESAVIAGDFRIDPSGHVRFAVFVNPSTDERRIGRIVQRICEIETYKSMSMLGFSRVRAIGGRMGEIDGQLTVLMGKMSEADAVAEETLESLLTVSTELENMLAQTAFRFGATGAYEALVNQRISVLREERFFGRQTFSEFMARRFDPAMRTVKSVEGRLKTMAERAARAADLLRTRVDVERSAQNQALLASMDRRADMQLRLQRTVEGFSVVAISYYAVNLLTYLTYPLFAQAGVTKGWAMALLTPLVLFLVWLVVRRIRKTME
ncbi:MAG: DUF3422 domain-containing protein [Silicimonas sp.]|nr:DUF3422 domain-containing protein [Silicimonas sp.]